MFECPIGYGKCECWLNKLKYEVQEKRNEEKSYDIPYPIGCMVSTYDATGYVNRLRTVNNIEVVRILWFSKGKEILKEYSMDVFEKIPKLYCNFLELPYINWKMLYFSWKNPGILRKLNDISSRVVPPFSLRKRNIVTNDSSEKKMCYELEKLPEVSTKIRSTFSDMSSLCY